MGTRVPSDFDYTAFLSYRSTDTRLAQRLHRALEGFRVPAELVGKPGVHGPIPANLGRLFRDRDEARSSEHIESAIRNALARSRHLVVLCTPAAAEAGSWVGDEIKIFREVRTTGEIHAAIGAGEPPACFPKALLIPKPQGGWDAPLAADLRKREEGGADGWERGVVRIAAGLLGVEFDDLWRRALRQRRALRVRRTVQAASAACLTISALAAGEAYRTHVFVEVVPSEVSARLPSGELVVTEESPQTNGSRLVRRMKLDASQVRAWIPASDVVVRLEGAYLDGEERAISWHRVLAPGFDWKPKRLRLVAPSVSEILAHPGMAWVPPTTWRQGRDLEQRNSTRPFWIDIRPPTVAEFLPVAERLVQQGRLDDENSFVLTARRRRAALDAVGGGAFERLGRDLGAVFGVIEQATAGRVVAPGDVVLGDARLPCPTCPAPVTRIEAEAWCQSRGMRLPNDWEWELAVRGADGRVYPWGDRFDDKLANVPGLPTTVGEAADLLPVDAYREYRSPFGLYDTVGNAGDWVRGTASSYERVYMGATYRYNPEDATTFRLLPVTESDLASHEITARCVSSTLQ
jgi:formylglycine-generating enzyme required for sulfatase activity